ncbi:FAM135B-like protein [Tanacetum coccineum]
MRWEDSEYGSAVGTPFTSGSVCGNDCKPIPKPYRTLIPLKFSLGIESFMSLNNLRGVWALWDEFRSVVGLSQVGKLISVAEPCACIGFTLSVTSLHAISPDLGADNFLGVWKIDDTDHSFSSQPFRIRYARQDILLSVMISFNLSLGKIEGPTTSAVILKFELLYAPVLENGSNLQDSLELSPAAVHEFRIPPKALVGLHSYCPVHFDAFHAVVVDTSVHITLLKGGVHTIKKASRSNSMIHEEIANEKYDKENLVFLVKSILYFSYNFTSQELRNSSVRQLRKTMIFDGFHVPKLVETKLLSAPMEVGMEIANADSQILEKTQNSTQVPNASFTLWSTFMKFHRANKTKVMDHLRNSYAIDRRAEWSIWMVYSKVEMPQQPTETRSERLLVPGLRAKSLYLSKIKRRCKPSQAAATRAELHRRSIAQMRWNSYFRNKDPKDINGTLPTIDSSFSRSQQKGRILKIAVFVHGFQACSALWTSSGFTACEVFNGILIDPKIRRFFNGAEVNGDMSSTETLGQGIKNGQ